jgi:hypothetical protein
MSQTYSRYSTHDFERRWRKRLDTSMRWATAQSQVEVTHRSPPPAERYGWELRPGAGLPVGQSRVQFSSWEEVSRPENSL